jgi:hypothetical protein
MVKTQHFLYEIKNFNMSTQKDTNGIDRPADSFETGGGGAVVLQKQKLAVNKNGYPLRCVHCNNFMIDPTKHNVLSDDDSIYGRDCSNENINITICSGCYFPYLVDGVPFGTHGDNYDCSFESNHDGADVVDGETDH